MKTRIDLNMLDFKKNRGLIPAVIQDKRSKEILMLGYMNKESFRLTLKTKWVHFWSRSRNRLWMKGEKSGNKLRVVNITSDCDNDSLLIEVKLIGHYTCHSGSRSCFFNLIE